MPKLGAKVAKKTAKAEPVTGEFKPYPPGKYIGTLDKVEPKLSSAGNPVWSCEFVDITNLDGDVMPGRQWYNLNLPQDKMPDDYKPKKGGDPAEKWEQYQNLCHGRLKAFFEAFGYEVDSDTDEFLQEKCVLQIGVGTIQRGPRTGQDTNQVNAVLPLDSVDGADAVASGGSDPDEF